MSLTCPLLRDNGYPLREKFNEWKNELIDEKILKCKEIDCFYIYCGTYFEEYTPKGCNICELALKDYLSKYSFNSQITPTAPDQCPLPAKSKPGSIERGTGGGVQRYL